eukprot:2802226-Pyramimonas_sp.AAC.1
MAQVAFRRGRGPPLLFATSNATLPPRLLKERRGALLSRAASATDILKGQSLPRAKLDLRSMLSTTKGEASISLSCYVHGQGRGQSSGLLRQASSG